MGASWIKFGNTKAPYNCKIYQEPVRRPAPQINNYRWSDIFFKRVALNSMEVPLSSGQAENSEHFWSENSKEILEFFLNSCVNVHVKGSLSEIIKNVDNMQPESFVFKTIDAKSLKKGQMVRPKFDRPQKNYFRSKVKFPKLKLNFCHLILFGSSIWKSILAELKNSTYRWSWDWVPETEIKKISAVEWFGSFCSPVFCWRKSWNGGGRFRELARSRHRSWDQKNRH